MSDLAGNERRVRRMFLAGAAALFCFAASRPAGADNLLPNSSFKLAANRTTPDYWDLHHAAALRFRDLYAQYNVVDDAAAPIAAARVLRIGNSEVGFPYVYLLSRQPYPRLPAGNYVFSVYAKADRPGNLLEMAPAWDRMDLKIGKTLTTEWRRYSAEFRVDDPDKVPLSPLLVFPSHGIYWISAPQLEAGDRLTPYAPAPQDGLLGVQTSAQKFAAADAIAAIASATTAEPAAGITAGFEFESYEAGEPKARLKVGNTLGSAFEGVIACNRPASSGDLAATGDEPPVFSGPIALNRGQSRIVEVPIAGSLPGEYFCSVNGSGRSAPAKLLILAPGALTVRINQFRNTLEIDKAGFQLRGIMVGGYVPPEWYFSDIAGHGINALFFYPREDASGLHVEDLDAVLKLADKYNVKVIVGPPVAGQTNSTWKSLLSRYADLVGKYRGNRAIIGWFVVDEPQAWTLHKNELAGIYDRIKALDPHRLVFINWSSDDVSARIGAEPPGSLSATDLYSIDYYPFGSSKNSLEDYTLRTIRALRTGQRTGRPGHSWLQLYGYLDVNREPTGDELNYMAYVNLLYGGNYSYWQTKSNAKPTWDRVRRINEEAGMLTKELMLNPAASELKTPTLAGHYLYSAWRTAADSYLIVLHVCSRAEPFALDLRPIFGPKVSRARTYFDGLPVDVAGSTLEDSFAAYATRVYKVD
jgi:hypothetical protein